MLQEFGHQFAAFVRYRDPITDVTMTDHLLNGVLNHWAPNFDDDKSPMDYDTNNWVELPNDRFRMVNLNSNERTYCNLDLYLMGLLGAGGRFFGLASHRIRPQNGWQISSRKHAAGNRLPAI